jgi:hypothetical protein
VGLGFRGKKISVFTVLFAPRIWKQTRTHRLFEDFRPLRNRKKLQG